MNWESELAKNITTIEELEEKLDFHYTNEEKEILKGLIENHPMSITHYYLSLIDRHDENDPIKKMCIPSIMEADLSGSFDTSGETENTVAVGLQHKYKQTGLILSTNQCAMYCRHCFRKRLVGLDSSEISSHKKEIFSYIEEHKEINNVLISGGDALLNSNKTIKSYLSELSNMSHLDIIRLGTRVPVTFPMRIYEDTELLKILKEFSQKKQIYIITHFNHPRELTDQAKRAIKALIEYGMVIKNQTVLLNGINSDGEVLAHLINELTSWGINPYYVFQCRPVSGVKNQFQVPLHQGYQIVETAKSMMNGVGKGFRYVMSNKQGKIEILGSLHNNMMLFKYHEAKEDVNQGKLFTMRIEDQQCWIEEDAMGSLIDD
jgi:lysine 2,3-aminomutase